MFFKLSSVLLGLLSLANAGAIRRSTLSRTSPPAGCVVVNASPSSGHFTTVQAAVNSLSSTATASQCIFIYPGTYKEQVYIPARTAQLTIYGYTTNTSSYHSNTVTITQGRSQDDQPSNDLTATLRAWNVGLQVYNINLENTRGAGRQALAVSAEADKQGFYGVGFMGYQDTILANKGNQIYAKCYIDGAVDFIFGLNARAWFSRADIRIKGQGFVTASGRDSASNPSYFVIDQSDIRAINKTVKAGSTYLGRPWRNYARVVVQNTYMTDVVNSAGWTIWTTGTPNTDHVFFREFGNTGAGAQGTRAAFSGKLTEPVTIEAVLGSNYASWVDTTYLK
ncbi:carbohydrate esterase family 8 protein [Sphaerosporella brunnea]|uniref:Pectinesterase n=1 Tax=Sphaerosporella brunnea TaxID=1250544 RepID=A0A5J5ETR8_9PEZI|nr:carbohydrate esterase family 8 protein [Sphaerosporella brunnea]